ncbi:uncharacterized protein [Dysidea avara]|uniref:uncharacterized protein n=1 Tax=Dysidea avara TaxID=196820 RepID=UPI0033343EE5
MLCNDMFLSHKESMNDCVSTNTTHSTFQQLRTKRFKKNGLVNCLVTIGSLIALMVECVVILLTTQKKIFKHNSYKEKSVRKKVKQFLTTDYVNVTEVIQIYPLGLVTSPKPKRKAQNQSYNGRDTNVQSTEVTSNSVRSNSPDASLSGRHENLRNNLPDDVIILTPSEESHYSDHSLLAITTSFAQELPHESPQLLANEQISQVSNPYSDEEEIREEPLLSTLQAAFLGIPDPINHSTQQNHALQEDTPIKVAGLQVDSHGLLDTVYQQSFEETTQTKYEGFTQIEVKEKECNCRRQNDVKSFTTELGTDLTADNPPLCIGHFPDGSHGQVSVPVGDNTCEMKLNTTQATVVEDENLLVA